MNEMKPEDVMRALECCASGTGGDACNDCPFNERNVCDNDMNAIEKAALAILREKDAEIERLNVVIETMEDNCMTCDYKIVDRVSTARAEAITEFAERLKKFYGHLGGKTVGGSVEYHINQVLKEMREKLGADTCVCCGDVIPEGRQVCPNCEGKEKEDESKHAESI
jgi:hypothetical protein